MLAINVSYFILLERLSMTKAKETKVNVLIFITKEFGKSFLFSVICFLAIINNSSAAEFEFRFHHFLSAKAPSHTKMLVPWAKAIEKNSKGRVKIIFYPSMTLGGKPPELINQVRDGVVDLIWTVNGYTPGLFPRTEVFELPNVYINDPVATNLAMQSLFKSDLQQEYSGLKVMFLHVHGGNGIHMKNDPVLKPSDLAGKRIRIPSRVGGWIIEAFNAIPIAMPVPDLPSALQKGVVDGALIPWEIIPPLKIHQQTKYQIEGKNKLRFGTLVFQVSMNLNLWNSLPKDIQKIFEDASDKNWLRRVGKEWQKNDDFGIAVAVSSGNKHIVLNSKQTLTFTKTLEPVVSRWIKDVTEKGINGKELVNKARKAIKKYSKK